MRTITIDKEAEDRLWAFIRGVDVEVGGMGYAFLQEDGTLHWSETFLIPQEVSSSEVDFEATGGDQAAIEKAIEDGVLDDPNFVWVSWHSHHTMKAYWSSTDDKRIAAMKQAGMKRLLSLVGAHDGEHKMRLDVFDVEGHGINIGHVTISDVGFEAVKEEPSEFEKLIQEEIEDNVTKKTYTFYSTSSSSKSDKKSDKAYDKGLDKKYAKKEQEAKDEEYSLSTGMDHADEARLIFELMEDADLTRTDAKDMIEHLGAEACEDMLWQSLQRETSSLV